MTVFPFLAHGSKGAVEFFFCLERSFRRSSSVLYEKETSFFSYMGGTTRPVIAMAIGCDVINTGI